MTVAPPLTVVRAHRATVALAPPAAISIGIAALARVAGGPTAVRGRRVGLGLRSV
jgi:hypothetical protein